MAIILPDVKKVILTPQKTGGTWTRGVLRQSEVTHYLSYPKIDKTLFTANLTTKQASQHMPEKCEGDWTVAMLMRPREGWENSYFNDRCTNREFGWGTCSVEVGASPSDLKTPASFWNWVEKKYGFNAYTKSFGEFAKFSTVEINIADIWGELKAFLPEYKLEWVPPMNVGRYI